MMRERRLITFRVPQRYVDTSPRFVACILDDMAVLRAEALYASDEIEYVAWHPLAAIVERGEMIPHLRLEIEKHGWGLAWKLSDKIWGSHCDTDAQLEAA